MEQIECKCEVCGKNTLRSKYYLEWEETVIVFKWKLKYCDKHMSEKITKSLNRAPEIMNALINKALNK